MAAGDTLSVNRAQNYGARNQLSSRDLMQNYVNMVGLADMADDTNLWMNPFCGCSGGYGAPSVFGQSGMYGMNGANGMYRTNGMKGYGPGSEIPNMSEMDYVMYQGMVEDSTRKENIRNQFASTVYDMAISRQVGILQRQMKNNEQDNVAQEYNKLLDAEKAKYKEAGITELTDKQVKAIAEADYYKIAGKSLTDDLTENGDSPTWQGFKRGLCFGTLTDKKDYKDSMSEITSEGKSKSDKIWKGVGGATGGAATGAAIGTVVGLIAGPIGVGLGAGVGAILGLIGGLIAS